MWTHGEIDGLMADRESPYSRCGGWARGNGGGGRGAERAGAGGAGGGRAGRGGSSGGGESEREKERNDVV